LKKFNQFCKAINRKVRPFLRPSAFLVFAIAWMITNGWAYIAFWIGIQFDIAWAKWVGTAYLTILWMPFTPEKLVTFPLAILIHKIIFKKSVQYK